MTAEEIVAEIRSHTDGVIEQMELRVGRRPTVIIAGKWGYAFCRGKIAADKVERHECLPRLCARLRVL